MDTAVWWDSLKRTAAEQPNPAAFRAACVRQILDLVAGSDLFPETKALPARTQARLSRHLDVAWRGGLSVVGALPQVELAAAAALHFVARGRRVLVVSGVLADPGTTRALADRLAGQLGIHTAVVGRSFGKTALSLADAGREGVVVERRSHVGGNVFDHVHPCGIRVHTYGPHYFRTGEARVRAYLDAFTAWREVSETNLFAP